MFPAGIVNRTEKRLELLIRLSEKRPRVQGVKHLRFIEFQVKSYVCNKIIWYLKITCIQNLESLFFVMNYINYNSYSIILISLKNDADILRTCIKNIINNGFPS